MQNATFLIGDIGGTHMRFWLMPCSSPELRAEPIFTARYSTPEFSHLYDALERLRGELPIQCGSSIVWCTLAVCGPVIRGQALCLAPTMGPSGWSIDERHAAQALRMARETRCQIINDFVAVGLALPLVRHAGICVTVHPGNGIDEGDKQPIACIGPGTGLGECVCIPTSRGSEPRAQFDADDVTASGSPSNSNDSYQVCTLAT